MNRLGIERKRYSIMTGYISFTSSVKDGRAGSGVWGPVGGKMDSVRVLEQDET